MSEFNNIFSLFMLSETLVKSAISAIAVPIFKSIGGVTFQLVRPVFTNLEHKFKQIIYEACHKYETEYEQRYGYIKILGMQKPVNLQSVYTGVQFLEKPNSHKIISITSLENDYRKNAKRAFLSPDAKKQLGIKVANNEQYLMVIGGPGSGKTTFLRKIGLEALKNSTREYKHKCIPVFLELKRLISSDKINITELIADEFCTCKFPKPDLFTKEALKQGKLLLLLDGLDEVPSERLSEVITKIKDFVHQYDKNRFIVSCRIAAYQYQSWFERFTDVVMADFDHEQIKTFIFNWFHSKLDQEQQIAQRCWGLLQKKEYSATKELAQTPLLLTLLCLVYDDTQSFPNNRASLYNEALEILLKKWAAEKRIGRDPIHPDFTSPLETAMLSEIAYRFFKKDRVFFSERELVQQIHDFFDKHLNAPKNLDGEAILKEIEIQQGILVERARDAYSFSHVTFQEYLTAQYIEDKHKIDELVKEYLINPRWQEIFLLVSGIKRGGSDELLLLMEQESRKFILNSKLQKLLCWADRITLKELGYLSPPAKRAAALQLASVLVAANIRNDPNFYNLDMNSAKALGYTRHLTYIFNKISPNTSPKIINTLDFFLNTVQASAKSIELQNHRKNVRTLIKIINELKIFKVGNHIALNAKLESWKEKIPDNNQPESAHRFFSEKVWQIWLQFFQLDDSSFIRLSRTEAQDLGNYLYATMLIVKCQQAAILVSRKKWEEIEERILIA